MTPRRSFVFLPALGTAMLPLVTAALLLAGCGDKFSRENFAPDGYTQVVLQNRAPLPSLNLMDQIVSWNPGEAAMLNGLGLTGELIVFALNRDYPDRMGRRRLGYPDEGSTTSWTIPNGKYSFYVVGYNPPVAMNYNLMGIGGTAYCGLATGDDSNVGTDVFLLGGSKQVTISTATSACSAPPFAPSGIASISLAFCNTSTNLASALDPTGATPCTAASSVTHVAVKIHEQDELAGPNYSSSPGLTSDCIALSSGVAALPFVPPGNPAYIATTRIKLEIAAYNNSTCGAPLAKYIFNTGLATANASNTPPWNVVKVDPSTGMPTEASDRAKWVSTTSTGRIFLKE